MSDYQLLNVIGVKEDSKAIIKVLKDIKDNKLPNDLRLLNYYHEIPVNYPAVVAHVEDDMVDLEVHQPQAVVMRHEKITFLKSSHFPHDVIAKVFRADVIRCIAILTQFAYAQARAERRRFVRVEVSDKIDVSFMSAEGSATGRLVDICIGGLSFSAAGNNALETQTNGLLGVVLEKSSLEIPGTLLKIVEEEGRYKYIFEIEATPKMESKISQFVFHRQLEIIKELKDAV